MPNIIYGKEGDDFIITKIDFGNCDAYLVDCHVGNRYYTIYSTFDFDKAVNKIEECEPHFYSFSMEEA